MVINLKNTLVYSPMLGVLSSRLLDQDVIPMCPYYCEKREVQKEAGLTSAIEKHAA